MIDPKVKKTIEKINESVKPQEDAVYIFVSMDLTDSTKLKSENSDKWIKIIKSFYAIMKTAITEYFPGFEIWKYIGDEVVFIKQLKGFKTINTFLDTVYDVQQEISVSLTDKYEKPITVKATTWIADVINDATLKDISEKHDIKNLMFTTNERLLDFIGQDIDIGFRIAKYSYPKAVTVSAKFAFFLIKKEYKHITKTNQDNFKIVSYQDLKGVWNKKLYPIIWYTKDMQSIVEKFESIPYEDYIEKQELKNIKLDNIDKISYLNTIFEQNKFIDEMNSFCELCADEIKNNESTATVIELKEEKTNNTI